MKTSESSPPKTAAVFVNVEALTPWAKNPRKNDPAVKAVADSIKRFGFGAPLLARQANGEIIAGHTRLKAAIKLGLTEVPVRYLDLTESEAHALALADNKVGELAEWDDAMLAEVLKGMAEAGDNIEGLGWSSNDIEALIGKTDLQNDNGDVPEVQEIALSKAGEVYQLGPHRLICGDSTDAATWKLLLGEELLQMVWTDPPYGVSYVGKTADALTIENDTMTNEELSVFLRSAFTAALSVCALGAPWYVAAPAGPKGIPFAVELHQLGLFRQRLAWVKDRFVLGHSDYHYRHEDLYFGYCKGKGRMGRGGVGWFSDNAQDSVFNVNRPSANREHPTMKPVELVQKCISNSSQTGWIIGEPFGGSGTTLLAAACEGRIARLIELSPQYCDVIRRRWTRWAKENNQDAGSGALDG